VVDQAGRYVVQLIVNDGFADSTPVTVRIDTENSPPVANAGATVPLRTTVQLDGRGSFDVDNNPLTYRWSFVSRPAGSKATFDDASAPNPFRMELGKLAAEAARYAFLLPGVAGSAPADF
jgi:hypothetical protein